MASRGLVIAALAAGLLLGGYLFWRHVWFFRDPERSAPAAAGLVSPADGIVVYARKVAPGEPVVVIKEGVAALVRDIVREEVDQPKLVVGVFMSLSTCTTTACPSTGRWSSCAAIPRSVKTST